MTRFYRRPLLAVLILGVLATLFTPAAATASGNSTRTYLVTVENLTASQPLTPPVAVTHKRSHDVFTVGAPASPGVQGLAENGDVPGLVAEQSAAPKVGAVAVGDANGPVLPGQSVTFEVEAVRGKRRLSVASMLICTNDGFAGLGDLRLPGRRGASVVAYANAYDAGTEINTEDFDDLVPPCGPLTGVDTGGAGNDTSDPTLAEGGVIAGHPGISGGGDLPVDPYDWEDPVAKITVTRIDGAAQYELTVDNTTTGQPFTPPVVAAHNRSFDLFTVGSHASSGIQGVAENGDVPGLVAEISGASGVRTVAVGGDAVLPDGSLTIRFWAAPGVRRVSLASMLICTNDGFTGLDSVRLPRWVGDSKHYDLEGYDAGTEINTEDFDDLVPPCGPLTGVDSGGAGTGTSNPALAEGGVISHHDGIQGGADLLEALHDWSGPVGEVTITRID